MASNHVQPATKPYGIVIHAGARETWKYDPKGQCDTQVILKKIVARAELELSNGASAIDVVRDTVTALEDCESFNAGRGAVLNIDGEHEVSRSLRSYVYFLKANLIPQLEAAIVNGTLGDYRAVAVLRRTKNPISLAHAMLLSPFPVLMIGQPADDLAQKLGLEMVENDYFTTSERAAHWTAQKARFNSAAEDLGTVGAVALDIHGNLAAANSTGGMTCKTAGRIGDTAIIGAGIYSDRRSAIAW
jgi:L-asparaginase / beta-aspartyl-peptidase